MLSQLLAFQLSILSTVFLLGPGVIAADFRGKSIFEIYFDWIVHFGGNSSSMIKLMYRVILLMKYG